MSKPKHAPGKGQLAGSSTKLDKPQCFIVGEGRWDHHFQLCNQLSCIVPVLSFTCHCFPPLPGTFLSFCACHQNTERHFLQGKRQVASNDFRKQIRIFRASAVIGILLTCYQEEDTSAAADINSTYQTVEEKQRFG